MSSSTASAQPAPSRNAVRTARPGGKLVLLGTGAARGADWTGVWFRELAVFGAFGQQVEQVGDRQLSTYEFVLELLSAGKLKYDGVLTHTFPLADYRRAFSAITAKRSSGVIKAAFKF